MNFKRKKCRYHARGDSSKKATLNATFRKRKGLKPIKVPDYRSPEYTGNYWPEPWGGLSSYPRAWDIIQHTKPHRARERTRLNQILKGFDPDNLNWPLWGKPHKYFW